MCGRIALYTPPARLARLLDAALAAGLEQAAEPPSWNVAPQRTLFGVADRKGDRVLDAYQWGLVPSWSKGPEVGARAFNARCETLENRPLFRDAFRRHRLAVPVDGFYEWDRRGGQRQPHFFTRADGDVLVLAGLFEHWRDRTVADAPWLVTCTVVTTAPGPDLDGIHDRMPVVLERDALDCWLDGGEDDLAAVRSLCRPAPAGTLVHHPVSPRVGNVRNDDPELIEAVEPSGSQQLF